MYQSDTSVQVLLADVQQDISDRSSWAADQTKWRDKRLSLEARKRLPYPGAPDLREPLIDDNISTLVSGELQVVWGARTIATFVPSDEIGLQMKSRVEGGFDYLLRRQLMIRSKIETIIDTTKERGMAIAKLTTREIKGNRYPDFDPIDPLDIIVPSNTRGIADADRVTHQLRYTIREFLDAAMENGWNLDAARQALQLAMDGGGNGARLSTTEDDGASRSRVGDSAMPTGREVKVYECYHFRAEAEDTDSAMPNLYGEDSEVSDSYAEKTPSANKPDRLVGKRLIPFLCVFVEGVTEPLKMVEWTTPPVMGVSEIIDPETGLVLQEPIELEPSKPRPWPFVQFRAENRSQLFYDVRGVSQKLAQDQVIANANLNAKGVIQDYTCKPFVKGTMTSSFRFIPGSHLPEGASLEVPMVNTQMLDYNIDIVRSVAARRVGAMFGALSSADTTRQAKTATESSITAQANSLFAGDNVERFAEPFGQLLTMMWEWLKEHPAPLKGVFGKEQKMIEELPLDIYELDYEVMPTASAKMANADMLLRQVGVIAELLNAYPEGRAILKADQLMRFVFETVNPILADIVVVDPATGGGPGGAPIQQILQQILAALFGPKGDGKQGIAAQVTSNTQYLMSLAQGETEKGDENAILPTQEAQ